MKMKHSFLKRNGLSITLLVFFLLFLGGQYVTGWHEYNNQQAEENQPLISFGEYASTGHFLQATFENWESEFLQMAMYVLFTVYLFQKGSAESKKLEGENEVDREPKKSADAPWPVRKGGLWLKLYSNSLTLAFGILFILSFILHFCGSLKDHNEEMIEKGKPIATASEYIGESRFWFESFQNWQSEFLAVLSIVVLSIFLRQKGSPESKPVDASNDDTEE
jgi:hypothetical protein